MAFSTRARRSAGGVRWLLHRLWNPKSEKGLVAKTRRCDLVPHVTGTLEVADQFLCTRLNSDQELIDFGRTLIAGVLIGQLNIKVDSRVIVFYYWNLLPGRIRVVNDHRRIFS
jgi:hypothetical protein